MRTILALVFIATLTTLTLAEWIPCSEYDRALRYPCRCRSEGVLTNDEESEDAIAIDCDRVVFPGGDFPQLPFGAPVVAFRQRWAGHQALPQQLFAEQGLPLRRLDFTGNSVRRLTEKLVTGLQSSLTDLILADNLLGDNLNPIFSTSEFHGLTHLSLLDLSGNSIRGIEEGILKGCDNLIEFRLDRNNLVTVPSASLNGPRNLRVLSLKSNRISKLRQGAFISQRSLERINLYGNMMMSIEGGAFAGLTQLRSLGLGHNRLSKFNSDVFQGAERLEKLDLSENFISEFPTVALKAFTALKHLNLSTNMLTHLDNTHLGPMTSLQALDLSRNNIAILSPGTFLGLKHLRYLDIGVNALRTVEDDAFEGLDSLETLLLRDNNILLIPASALGRLPRLSSIHLGYNRVTAVSSDILRSMAERVSSLVLARNVIRELPPAAFQHFKYLTHLDLNGNLLNVLSAETFMGLEDTLEYLSLAQNRILSIGGPPVQFVRLWYLDLSGNQLSELSRNAFVTMPNLSYLNMSHNPHLNMLPHNVFHHLPELTTIDLNHNGLKTLPVDLFAKTPNLEYVHMSDNAIQEIPEGAFVNMRNLTVIDLSNNNIVNIRQAAFVNVMNIQQLYLKGNQLNAFKGEFFNTGTSLEILDMSDNQLSYLFPSSFRIHPRLRRIVASGNKFNFFPAELIASLQYLQHVDLSKNALKSVEELDFARLPRLRELLLSHNEIESISEMAFHNSTQLQVLDLGNNNLERLGERTFEGLTRLEMLNLENNLLSELPDLIFDRTRLQMLENVNLARNAFEVAPLKALQKQYFFVSSVDLSHNKLVDIPAEDSVMVNIKKLDLSFNPLSKASIKNVIGEPKTVRDLNMAGTGIEDVSQLETPFLHRLNLSYNNITNMNEKVFDRTTLLESLDLSHNKINDLSSSIPKIWPSLKSIQSLNLSSNPIVAVTQKDFEGLESLRLLSIENLEECTKMEKNAFKPLVNLATLNAYNYPKLGYLDVQGILASLPVLQNLDIEIKDVAVGSEQLQSALHPRLQQLGIRGDRLKSVSSGALAGLKSQNIAIKLRNTSLSTIPPALLFPLPRSSRVELDVTGSMLTSLQPQLLVALDDRRADLSMLGLDTNPIRCDCGARALRRWLPASKMTNIKCSSPEYLAGLLLVEIGDDELTCDPRKHTTTTTTTTTTAQSTINTSRSSLRYTHRTTAEPDIIWSIAPMDEKPRPPKGTNVKGASVTSQSPINNDDTLIIGIVGGVVAFIAILVIIICIVRLRMSSSSPYRGGPMAGMTPIYAVPPYGATLPPNASISTATLPHKLHSAPASIRPAYATMSRTVPYYPQNPPTPQPYFVSMPPHDEKIYR